MEFSGTAKSDLKIYFVINSWIKISSFLLLLFNSICFPCLKSFSRLSTTWDEVSVYPIPAALYLIKNLLQVGFSSSCYKSPVKFEFLFSADCYLTISVLAVLHLRIRRCSRLPNTKELQHYQHWCTIPYHSQEKVSHSALLLSSLHFLV